MRQKIIMKVLWLFLLSLNISVITRISVSSWNFREKSSLLYPLSTQERHATSYIKFCVMENSCNFSSIATESFSYEASRKSRTNSSSYRNRKSCGMARQPRDQTLHFHMLNIALRYGTCFSLNIYRKFWFRKNIFSLLSTRIYDL